MQAYGTFRPPDSMVLLEPSFHLSGHATLDSFFSHLAHTIIAVDRTSQLRAGHAPWRVLLSGLTTLRLQR